mgnify:CR=1 FL=1
MGTDLRVQASSVDKQTSKDFFYFLNENQKINSDGTFAFSYGYYMTSTSFRPNSSSFTMVIKATSSSSTDTVYNVNIYQRTSSGNDIQLKSSALNANGQYQVVNITGANPGASCYLEFTKPLFSSATFTGEGRLYDVTVP